MGALALASASTLEKAGPLEQRAVAWRKRESSREFNAKCLTEACYVCQRTSPTAEGVVVEEGSLESLMQ